MGKKIFDADGVPTIAVEDESAINSGFQLIDVRRPDEYIGELGHIPGATLATLGPELMNHLENHADKTTPTIFICRSGARSAQATLIALDLGFKEVYNLEGGMLQWNESGFQTEN